MALTETEVLLDVHRRIADIHHSLSTQLGGIRRDLDMHRWQTVHYRTAIMARLDSLETKPISSLARILDMTILIRILIAAILAGTGVLSVTEAVKVAVN
jgi:hypothetical protein